MIIVMDENHRRHDPRAELSRGALVPHVETASRVGGILAALKRARLGSVMEAQDFGAARLLRVHTPDYLDFLHTAWDEWEAAFGSGRDALPFTWPMPDLLANGPRGPRPEGIMAKMGHYSFDAGTPITPGTWAAVNAAAQTALTAARLVAEEHHGAFALCRPPGHHAAQSMMGGYCYVNNAAVAAQALIDAGAARVAILDVDYHHGNGTQSIFYDRPDVLFISIHADPREEYPYFSGFADETGRGEGQGANLNLPLAKGSDVASWVEALRGALGLIHNFGPDALIVSLGVDTAESDPLGTFQLLPDDFVKLGAALAALKRPTVFVMEGGYDVGSIGESVVSVLSGFEG